MKLSKAVIYALLGLVCFIALVKIAGFVKQPETQNSGIANLLPSNPLGYFTEIDTSKGTIYILIHSDYIDFNPNESAINNGTRIIIRKEDYSKLFEQGAANKSVLRVVLYRDPQSDEELIELSNNQPDHGGFASTYVLLVDPFSGEIKESKNDYSVKE